MTRARISLSIVLLAVLTGGIHCVPHSRGGSPRIASGTANEQLPVRRVVLFQNGVAYIERRGEFQGDELRLRVLRPVLRFAESTGRGAFATQR